MDFKQLENEIKNKIAKATGLSLEQLGMPMPYENQVMANITRWTGVETCLMTTPYVAWYLKLIEQGQCIMPRGKAFRRAVREFEATGERKIQCKWV